MRHRGTHDRIIGLPFCVRKARKPVMLGARPRCRRRQQEGFLMCENTGTGPALDVMAFTLSHSTNARNALSLYEEANWRPGRRSGMTLPEEELEELLGGGGGEFARERSGCRFN